MIRALFRLCLFSVVARLPFLLLAGDWPKLPDQVNDGRANRDKNN